MIRFEIIENNFSRRSTNTYELSILMGMDSFSYIVSNNQKQILALKDYTYSSKPKDASEWEEHLRSIINEDRYLKLNHQNIRVGLAVTPFVLIPDRLYKEGKEKTYLKELTSLNNIPKIMVDEISNCTARNVFAVDQVIVKFISGFFPGSKVFHLGSSMIAGLKRLSTIHSGPHLYVNVQSGELMAVLLEDGVLQFINVYQYQSVKDFLYYILLIYDQFSLKTDRDPLHLSGKLMEDSEIYRLLYRYINKLSFLEPPAFLDFGPKLNLHPKYFYFDLLSLNMFK